MPSNLRNSGPHVKIKDPQAKEIAQHVLDTMKLGVLKGLAHTIDPQTYPNPSATDTVEQLTVAYFKQRPRPKQEAAQKNVHTFLKQQRAVTENLFGPLSKVDLRSNTSIKEQVQKLNLSATLRMKRDHLCYLEFAGNTLRRREGISLPTVSPSMSISLRDLGDRPHLSPISRQTVLDPIEEKYNELDGKTGFLGNASGGRGTCPDGRGQYQHYQGGSIYWSLESGAHEVHGQIRDKWESLGWETSFLGYPLTDELSTSDGRFNHFQGGSIYWTAETGAHEIHGAIMEKWSEMSWERSYLGYPVTDELTTPDTIGRYNHFQGGSIYWTPDTGAHAVHKKLRDKWESMNWELGFLGYPITDTVIDTPDFGSMRCYFQGGGIECHKGAEPTLFMPATKLRLRIYQVKCIVETDPDWLVSDEIKMGGVATSVNDGSVTKVSAFWVSEDIDSGQVVDYWPPKDFFTFHLLRIPGWPKGFIVTMALGEVDSGGFNDFLKNLVENIRDEVIKYVAEETAALTGAALGAYIGALGGGVIGAVIGALVGWIAGELFNWIISWFEDDPFPIWSASIVLPSVWHSWSGYAASPQDGFWTEAHGGRYEVIFDWALGR